MKENSEIQGERHVDLKKRVEGARWMLGVLGV